MQRWERLVAFKGVLTDPNDSAHLNGSAETTFEDFAREAGGRLRQVLVAQYGVDIGCEATNAALAWAWEHWHRLSAMDNPAGYLYRVARTQAGRELARGRPVVLPAEEVTAADGAGTERERLAPDGELARALRLLPERQRLAVLLVHAYGWTPAAVGSFTGINPITVRSHLRRGLRALRKQLNESSRP